MKTLKVLLFALSALAAARSSAQVTIGLGVSAIDSGGPLGARGLSNQISGPSYALAQRFNVPTQATQLNDFRFFLSGYQGSLQFTAYVSEWNGSVNAVGPAVWSSTPQAISVGGYLPYTFQTGGLVLDASKSYAFILLADGASTGSASVALTGNAGSGISGQAYSFSWPGTITYNSLTTPVYGSPYGYGQWSSLTNPNSDYYFAATFDQVGGTYSLASLSAVPEPSLPGLAIGLSGLAGYAAWRRRKTAQVTSSAA